MEIDVGQWIARPVRLAQSKGRGPGLFNYSDRGNVRCGPARAIGPGKHPRDRSQRKEKAHLEGQANPIGLRWGYISKGLIKAPASLAAIVSGKSISHKKSPCKPSEARLMRLYPVQLP